MVQCNLSNTNKFARMGVQFLSRVQENGWLMVLQFVDAGELILRKYFILAFVFLIFISCRGGAANTSNQVTIPIFEPTPSDMYCQKQYDFVESYPQLDELRSNELTLDESGIEYFIFQEGNEEKPNLEYLVTAKYTGWLENGCVFDSSILEMLILYSLWLV